MSLSLTGSLKVLLTVPVLKAVLLSDRRKERKHRDRYTQQTHCGLSMAKASNYQRDMNSQPSDIRPGSGLVELSQVEATIKLIKKMRECREKE